MREILFRGKRKSDGTWFYGDVYHTTEEPYDLLILYSYTIGVRINIIPETVGQFTGLTDKNGAKIFEGDRLCVETLGWACRPVKMAGTIEFFKGSFDIVWDEKAYGRRSLNSLEFDKIKVIGNIHDNPDDVFEKFSVEQQIF